ncbi:hypothetical protein K493DRAFT_351319 [Basidiobolus meristosporus CBS 931.73]|uniref:Gfd2/YDR514C-like C-terminal domain-containing protein n=1 Tax=Basidiobolus meristosporus CBS 931.73 TaxID=1314790 RepID=A0A1Y1YCR1_9FUNG|nr:hypothetical protein K493DRAFT_351319 [Basidiobolus meristosporus CBS 931.73]|eukprot:ORX95762.1 hypothetical protein K493DRAFT_351319 [Basidiobolus meristosporus CBS 931.73]
MLADSEIPDDSLAPYFMGSELEAAWLGEVQEHQEKRSKIVEYFKPPNFYVQKAGTTFYLGTNAITLKRYILISYRVYRDIKCELESLLDATLSEVQAHNQYQEIQETHFDSTTTYFKVVKMLGRRNKKSKKKVKALQGQKLLENAKSLLVDHKHMFFTIDVETYERDHTSIIEIGWSMHHSKRGLFKDRHFVIEENLHLRNGRYHPDNKEKFLFGESELGTLEDVIGFLEEDLSTGPPKVLIGHDLKSVLEATQIVNPNLDCVDETLDISDLHTVKFGGKDMPGLSRVLDDLEIDYYCLHNAGNDAHYIMEAFLKLVR